MHYYINVLLVGFRIKIRNNSAFNQRTTNYSILQSEGVCLDGVLFDQLKSNLGESNQTSSKLMPWKLKFALKHLHQWIKI